MRSALFLAVFAAAVGRGGCDPTEDYFPCDGKGCGDTCRLCAPNDPSCVETAVVKSCDARGECVASGTFTCEPPPPYDPCAGKGCGEYCDPCAPDEPCPMYFAATACDPLGQCVTVGTFTCEPPPPPADPCAGKLCGDDCVIDPPCAPLCLMPSILGKCDPLGSCQPVTEMKCGPTVDPCAGKLCGDACSTCDPMLGMCPAVMEYCDALGRCGYTYPVCTTTVP